MKSIDFPEKWIRGFEEAFKKVTGCKYALAVNSGTSALHLALRALNVKSGDEVICPTFTFVGTINPIIYCGATPVFIDSERSTWNIDPDILESTINDRLAQGKRPKAIIVVHIFGMPASLKEIIEVAAKFDIPVVEDAAQALGSFYKKEMVGNFGDLGIISFNNNKIVTTYGGGILMTSKSEKRDFAEFLSRQAKSNAPHYEHVDVGYNYQMNGWGAYRGIEEISKLDQKVSTKREIFKTYYDGLKEIPGITFQAEPKELISNRWVTAIRLEDQNPALVKDKIEKLGFSPKFLWNPMHCQPIFSDFPYYGNGFSERLFKSGLCLPSEEKINRDQQYKVIDAIFKNLGEKQCNNI